MIKWFGKYNVKFIDVKAGSSFVTMFLNVRLTINVS